MPKVIVLDTHIWLWFVNGNIDNIPETWLEKIEKDSRVGIAAVSCYELALAHKKGRLELPYEAELWIDKATTQADIELFPITAEIAHRAVNLSPVHKDPFDRIIIATALSHSAQLASVDKLFPKYVELKDCLMQAERSGPKAD
ncbi:MAG: PIN domain-containing protein [Cyanobacteria bacterium P01_D01_bin.36]